MRVEVPAQRIVDAYEWARKVVDIPLVPVPSIGNPVAHGLDAGLDHVVKAALDATGLMDMLERVTGKLDELTAAAQEWQAQGKAVREVADALRGGALTLPGQWEGAASQAFGTYMGQVVAAVDATAADMEQTARIISQAAAECRLAEEMVIEIIREAVEALIVSLAAMAVIDIVTLGLATLADALIADAEIAVFVARVARVSEQLAAKLEELMRAVRQLRTAGRGFEEVRAGLRAAKDVRRFGSTVGRVRAVRDALREPSLANVGGVAATQAVGHATGLVKDGIEGVVGSVVGADGVTDPVEDALTDDTDLRAVAREVDGEQPAPPYRVTKPGVEEAFG